jgi:hypothetical protein
MDAALPAATPQALSNVLWAAARLQLLGLPGNWLDSVLERIYQVRVCRGTRRVCARHFAHTHTHMGACMRWRRAADAHQHDDCCA